MTRSASAATFTSLVATALLLAGCVGQASPAPSAVDAEGLPSASVRPSQRPQATAKPRTPAPHVDLGCAEIAASQSAPYPETTLPPPPSPTIADPDAVSIAAITSAADALGALRSYRMTVDAVGMSLADLQPTSMDFGVRGTVSHASGFAMDALVGTRMREPDNSAAISGGGQYVVGNGYVWAIDNVSGVLEPAHSISLTELMEVVTPEGIAKRAVIPFAGGYQRIGTTTHGGVKTVHYRASKRGAEAYAAAFHFDGPMTADLWIASGGGELTAVRIAGTASRHDPSTGKDIDTSVLVAFEVTDPNAPANVIELPVEPIADPVRPNGPPVDLKLEYQVMPANGTSPSAADLSDIAVSLRYRLDISNRPVKVDQVGTDRLVVTVCGTTRPEADRRLISSAGALTVVPLPATDYGTSTTPGARALPTEGDQIDPALRPIAPASGVGLSTAHVDPTTGRRGLALFPGNPTADAFRAYATTHPGEFVAVALDGIVLAVLPIEGTTATAHFVFTGDYTEAETHLLTSYLSRDPIAFQLRATRDVEVPSD